MLEDEFGKLSQVIEGLVDMLQILNFNLKAMVNH